MPDVSVIMPCYNVSRYPVTWIKRALASVGDAEICAGDDFSTDNTADILRSIKPDIKIARTTYNTGGAGADNAAAELATGKYFILLSCRSWYEAGAIQTMSRFLDEHPNIGFVYGCTRWHGNRLGLKKPPEFKAEDFKKTFASSFGYMYRREAWDAGYRYGCQIYIPEENKHMTIGDRHMAMNLVFRLKWKGYCLQDTVTLNYILGGGVEQQNDYFTKYNSRMMAEFHKLWRDVL